MYDLVIIGGSAAGSAAAVYASRRKLDFALISDDFGGEMARAGEVLNWPSVTEITGIGLTERFKEQLAFNNVEPQLGIRVEEITKTDEGHFIINAKKGDEALTFETTAVIVATGVHPRHLEVPGEEDLYGRGVTYCTTCDGPLFKGKKTVTIGGGNSALESALMMAEIASEVTIINIHDKFKGEQVLIDKVTNDDRINVIYNARTTAIEGEPLVERVVYEDKETGEEKTVETQGVFVHIGLIPNSSFIGESVEKNHFKELVVDKKCQTSVPGLFAAGDVTDVAYKQLAIAAGQGVTAALSAIEYINQQSS